MCCSGGHEWKRLTRDNLSQIRIPGLNAGQAGHVERAQSERDLLHAESLMKLKPLPEVVSLFYRCDWRRTNFL